MTISDPFPRAAGADRDGLPDSWLFEARGLGETFHFQKPVRPWDWAALGFEDAAQLWIALEDFVAFFNVRYVERMEQRIPPCWPEHGALVEELTTLFFARWQAFESDHASIGGAQYWHQYSVPGFLDRMGRWVGPDRLERCRQGQHEEPPDIAPPAGGRWEHRRSVLVAADLQLREEDGREHPPRERSTIHFLDDKRAGQNGDA